MKIEKRLVLMITLSAIVSTMFLASLTSTARAQQPSAQLVIQPSFTYYANYTTLPAKLTFNISVVNVTDMATWQLSIRWNNSLLTYGLISIPSDNVFSPQSLIVVAPDLSTPGMLVYGANIPPGGNTFNGSGVIAQLQLNVTTTVTPPVSCAIELADIIEQGTFILDSQLVSMPITGVNAAYAYTYAIGTQVTHSISGSSNLVVTQSNGTIGPNSTGINKVSKTISFNVTGNTGDKAFLYAILPKDVINVTALSHWNVTVNGVLQSSPQVTENTTHTFVFTTFPFASQVTLGVQGDWIIPELSSMLIILIIASSATVAIAKSRTRRK